jgi:flagellar protein FlaG
MKIEAISTTGNPQGNFSVAADKLETARKKHESAAPEAAVEKKTSAVPTEEIISQIKGMTEDGLYSVRFEQDESSKQFVVRVVDRESGEIIRQLPPEELLGLKASLADLRGNLVDTKS